MLGRGRLFLVRRIAGQESAEIAEEHAEGKGAIGGARAKDVVAENVRKNDALEEALA